jgi:integrase
MGRRPDPTSIHAPGVSAKPIAADRWRVRWREGDRDRESTFNGPAEGNIGVRSYVAAIAASLAEHGAFTPAARQRVERVPDAPLRALLDAWVDANAHAWKGKTEATYRAYGRRVLAALDRLGVKHPTVRDLGSDLFERLRIDEHRMGTADTTRYGTLRALAGAWEWGADKNREASARGNALPWLGLTDSPRDTRPLTGKPATYRRTIAPTLAECDAALRHLPPKTTTATRVLGAVMRFTGLRAFQAAAIHAEDIDRSAALLTVRVGKTASEQADMRTMPVARALLADPLVAGWLDAHPSGPLFPKRRHSSRRSTDTESRTHHATVTFREAWESATAACEVRRVTWEPPNRKNARPEHGFRAALQAHMMNERVDADVIDFLVGHEGEGVREKFYARELLEAARVAVDALPAIAWCPPEDAAERAGNVVALRR